MLLEKPMRSVCFSWLACFGLILAGGPGTAAGNDTARGVTFYTVPLVCGAAPHIGCGGRAKPVLLELEKHGDVAEAWLNRAGTLLAVVWKDSSDLVGRDRTIQAVFEKHEMAANAVEGKEYRKLLKEFQGRKGWLRGADVDKLSEEEAEVIAERLVRRIGAKTPLTEEKSETLKSEFAGTLKKRFNRSQAPDMGSAEAKTAAGRKKEIENELLETGGKHLNEAERRALEEALALGMRPTEEESKRSNDAAPLEAPRQGSVPREASAKASGETKAVKYRVQGMTCAGCGAMIEGALLKTKGVQSAEISFEKSEATVQIDPGQISERQVAEVIEKAGYRAEIR